MSLLEIIGIAVIAIIIYKFMKEPGFKKTVEQSAKKAVKGFKNGVKSDKEPEEYE